LQKKEFEVFPEQDEQQIESFASKEKGFTTEGTEERQKAKR
jgi:hypothetical protein